MRRTERERKRDIEGVRGVDNEKDGAREVVRERKGAEREGELEGGRERV